MIDYLSYLRAIKSHAKCVPRVRAGDTGSINPLEFALLSDHKA